MVRIARLAIVIVTLCALPALIYSAGCSRGEGSIRTDSATEPAKDYVWVRAIAPGKGRWPEACAQGQWPRTLVPVEAFGKLWMIGMGKGNKSVWRSNDGIIWDKEQSDAAWGERYNAKQVVFKNRIWALGGTQVSNDVFRNDVWSSKDGKSWTLATAHAGWSARGWHTALVFNDKIWVLGGTDNWGEDGKNASVLNDVWCSSDGVEWTRVVEHAPWPARSRHVSVVFDNKMWVIGGTKRNDVWYSTDGKDWKQATANAGWPLRAAYGGQVFDQKLWIFGGDGDNGWMNDVWYSADGANWTMLNAHAPWTARTTEFSAVFDGKMWIFAGKSDERSSAGDRGMDDVWYLMPNKSLANR
jgi:hypothetical protein